MPKKIPSESPEYCWSIAQASYEDTVEKSDQLLQNRFPSAKVLEEKTIHGWRCILVEKDDRLAVAFRGTDNWHNWLGNVWHEFFGAYSPVTKQFEKQFEVWELKHGKKIELITAHSGGAIYGDAVRKGDDIARVFFNPHKIQGNGDNLLLVTGSDFLSRSWLATHGDPRAEIQKLSVVGKGGHGIADFEPYMVKRDWSQIEEDQQQLRKVLEGSKKSRDLSNEYIGQLESGEAQLRPDEIQPFQENLRVKRAMLEEAQRSQEFLSNFNEATNTLASKFQHLLEQTRREDQQARACRQESKQRAEAIEWMNDQMNFPSSSYSYASLVQTLQHHRHPQTGIRLVEEIQELTQCYDRQIKRVLGDLDHTHDTDRALRELGEHLDRMDQSQQEAYHELLKIQQSIGKKLRKLEMICAGVDFICQFHPTTRAVAAVAMPIIGTLARSPLSKQLNQSDRRIQMHGAALQRNLDTRGRLLTLSERNKASRDLFLQNSILVLEDLSSNSSQFVPSQHRQKLQDVIQGVRGEIDSCDKTVGELNQKISSQQAEVKKKQDEIDHLNWKKIGKKHEKDKKKIESKVIVLESERGAINARIAEFSEEIRVQHQEKTLLMERVASAEKELDKASRNADFRDRLWTVVETRSHWIGADTERAKEIRREMHDAVKLFSSAIAPEREMVHGFLGNVQSLALAFGYQGQAINALAAGYQIFDQIQYWRAIAVPKAITLINEYGNPFAAIAENVGMCVSSFLNPAIGIVLAGVQLINAVRSMVVKSKDKSPFQILSEQISRGFTDLEEAVRKRMRSEIRDLKEAIFQELIDLKQILNQSTAHICDQIKALREENTNEHGKTRAQAFFYQLEICSYEKERNFSVKLINLCDLRSNFYPPPGCQILQNISKCEVSLDENQQIFIKEFNEKLRALIDYFHLELNTFEMSDSLTSDELAYIYSKSSYSSVLPFTTGLVLNKVNSKKRIVNWKYLSMHIKNFIELTERIERRGNFTKALKDNVDLKDSLLNLCQEFNSQFSAIEEVRGQIGKLILKIQRIKESFYTITRQMLGYPAARPPVLTSLYRQTVENFGWDLLIQNLVAEKKFSFHTEFIRGFSQKMGMLKRMLEPRYLDYYNIYEKYRLCKTFTLGFWYVGKSNQSVHERTYQTWWSRTWGDVTSPEALLTKVKSDAVAADVLSFQKEINQITDETPLSEKETKMKKLSAREYQLSYDLKKRRIVWIGPKQTNNHLPLIGLKIDDSTSRFSRGSEKYDEDQVKRIREAGGEPNREYRKSLEGLFRNYRTALLELVEGKVLNDNHPLAALNRGEIVLSSDLRGVPLVFPKALLRHMESCLNPSLRYIQTLGKGIFIPRYEFSTTTKEFTIHYQIESASRPGVPFKFAKFKIANFDQMTVDSFKPDLMSNEPFDPTEFIIQAMYGKYAEAPLGLPGEKSLVLPGIGQVIPSEDPFEGLFSLWEAHPNRVIHYDSQILNRLGADNPFEVNSFENLPEDRNNRQLVVRQEPRLQFISIPISFEVSEDYMRFISIIEKEKKDLVDREKQYEEDFKMLKILFTIYSNTDLKTILERLQEDFEIFPPEKIDILYDLPSLEPLSPEKLDLFLRDVFASPSKMLFEVASMQESMHAIVDWVSGHSEQLNLPARDRYDLRYDEEGDLLLKSMESILPMPPISCSGVRLKYGDSTYVAKEAVPSGANALHALLGVADTEEMYQMAECRKKYVARFKSGYQAHKKAIDEQLLELLQLYQKGVGDPNLNYLFSVMQKEIQLLENLEKISETENEKKNKRIQFVQSKTVQEKYLDVCLQEQYSFSDCEIAIAANLFGKKVHLLRFHSESNSFKPISYGPEEGEPVVISYQNGRYSRCVKLLNVREEAKYAIDQNDNKETA